MSGTSNGGTERRDARGMIMANDYARGYDEGQADVWDAIVCSVCGWNHDRDESAACDECEPVTFREWVTKQKDGIGFLHRLVRDARVLLWGEELGGQEAIDWIAARDEWTEFADAEVPR